METAKRDASDSEDVPSDFFDDFNKDEFMEGLQVIDSWDDQDKKRRMSRIDTEALDSVDDLRELIDGRDEHRSREKERLGYKRQPWRDDLDDYIKPGSRRDPNKTKEAIKRDKAVKVKEYLAKSLDSTDELKPPGTELDDFFEENKTAKALVEEPPQKKKRSRSKERFLSPVRHQRRSPRRSPVHRSQGYRSPGRRSPGRRSPGRRSPRPSPRWSPRRAASPFRPKYQLYKPRWHPPVNRHFSPRRSPRRSPRHSPHRSPHRSPRRRYSRSPPPRRYSRRSRSSSPRERDRDSFLYPRESKPDYLHSFDIPDPQFANAHPGAVPGYPYPQTPQEYSAGYAGPPFDFLPPGQLPPPGIQIPFPNSAPVPQPVPAPMMNPEPPMMNPIRPMMNPVPPPAMVPAPSQVPSHDKPQLTNPVKDVTKPFDALAQLVAEGKITQEDYLKLAPTKVTSMDTNKRVMVLNRCNMAMSKLANLLLPNHLIMNNSMVGPESKSLVPKYCSPLKRQGAVEFHFTKMNGQATAQQNKQLVDSIIGRLGLDKIVTRPKTKVPKDMKDAACQTSKPYCDVCEVRAAVRQSDASTGVDPEHFSSTVHTQVVEQDLISSKAVFAPSGSIADGAPISIAHMTPAQLVSQLAARAKTLKQSDPLPPNPNQYMRRPNSYDQQNNYNNYRY